MQIPSSYYTLGIMNKHSMFSVFVIWTNEKPLEQFIDGYGIEINLRRLLKTTVAVSHECSFVMDCFFLSNKSWDGL